MKTFYQTIKQNAQLIGGIACLSYVMAHDLPAQHQHANTHNNYFQQTNETAVTYNSSAILRKEEELPERLEKNKDRWN